MVKSCDVLGVVMVSTIDMKHETEQNIREQNIILCNIHNNFVRSKLEIITTISVRKLCHNYFLKCLFEFVSYFIYIVTVTSY